MQSPSSSIHNESNKGAEKRAGDGGQLRGDSLIRFLLGRRAYGFMALLIATLFPIYYYILEPSNFSSFSDTLRYFISALSTLLAVVVSFNTLVLRNQLKNMPTNMERLNSQLDKIANLLQPAEAEESNSTRQYEGGKKHNPALYYTDAMEAMLVATKKQAESLVNHIRNQQPTNDNSRQEIFSDFISQMSRKLQMYAKYKSSFFLVSISTTAFIERMRFSSDFEKSKQAEEFFETAKRLHVIRNISVRIFIRNMLTRLSFDMLVFTIPIIVFAAIISAISNYGSYDPMFLRLLFAASMSTVALPFILLFIRTMPVLQLIADSSSIPFARENK